MQRYAFVAWCLLNSALCDSVRRKLSVFRSVASVNRHQLRMLTRRVCTVMSSFSPSTQTPLTASQLKCICSRLPPNSRYYTPCSFSRSGRASCTSSSSSSSSKEIFYLTRGCYETRHYKTEAETNTEGFETIVRPRPRPYFKTETETATSLSRSRLRLRPCFQD